MRKRLGVLAASLALSGCVPAGDPTVAANDGFMQDVPEAVLAAAAPFQDLSSVVLMPEDGCYWYRHRGPVETTMLPLLTTAGRSICTRPQTGPIPAG
jgi:hypothetical protein